MARDITKADTPRRELAEREHQIALAAFRDLASPETSEELANDAEAREVVAQIAADKLNHNRYREQEAVLRL
jgi:hypothetical protein